VSKVDVQGAVGRLDEVTRRLRRECPWDREQDERSIVPHTVEEAYELADAAHSRDDAKLLDELGDVLFQVHFLSLLLEERGAGDLAAVADHCTEKLVRRHPHVFGEGTAAGLTSTQVLRNWDAIKREERGPAHPAHPAQPRGEQLFGDVPENLPALLHARRLQRRAASSGFDFPGVEGPLQSLREEIGELEGAICLSSNEEEGPVAGEAAPGARVAAGETARPQAFHELGDVLFAAVNLARKLRLDPELALRASSDRFRARLEAAAESARRDGEDWDALAPERQLEHYARARLAEGGPA
jgi:MazG family protein